MVCHLIHNNELLHVKTIITFILFLWLFCIFILGLYLLSWFLSLFLSVLISFYNHFRKFSDQFLKDLTSIFLPDFLYFWLKSTKSFVCTARRRIHSENILIPVWFDEPSCHRSQWATGIPILRIGLINCIQKPHRINYNNVTVI